MEILHISAELAPVCKVGGLADVVHGLPRALIAKKQQVAVVIPKYNSLNLNEVKHLEVVDPDLPAFFDGSFSSNTVWRGEVDSIPIFLIESHHPREFFDRGKIYGGEDDIDRFLYYNSVILSYLVKLKTKPDIVHIHDWHTGLIAGLLKEKYPEIESKIVFTIHNLLYQGLCQGHDLEKVNFKNAKLKEGDHYNLLKSGIVFADRVTTVSPNYAEEILNTDLGGDLRATLRKNQEKFSGILNGIDYTYWNPKTDPFLPFHYSEQDVENKQKVKTHLRRSFSLVEENCPIVAAIARLVPQKGPEMIKSAILRTLELGGQFVLLGSAYENDQARDAFVNLKRKLAGSRHVHLELSYNEELSHLVYAGSDLFIVPSLFEPCGLTQMIAMRYGTVPLVRKTGGLADTVFDGINGFTFLPPTHEGISEGLTRACEIWYCDRAKWQKLVEEGLKSDFSWTKPAEEYLKLYRSLLRVQV